MNPQTITETPPVKAGTKNSGLSASQAVLHTIQTLESFTKENLHSSEKITSSQ